MEVPKLLGKLQTGRRRRHQDRRVAEDTACVRRQKKIAHGRQKKIAAVCASGSLEGTKARKPLVTCVLFRDK